MTLVELLVVILMVGILARIAIPAYERISVRARAAAAVADMEAVRTAAYTYNTRTNAWPADQLPGQTPPELEAYLGSGFSFDRGHYQLDWENWELPDGTPKHPETGVLIGVSITTRDEHLGSSLVELVGTSRLHYTLGDNYTFIIAGT